MKAFIQLRDSLALAVTYAGGVTQAKVTWSAYSPAWMVSRSA
jgi:hypothetical protein